MNRPDDFDAFRQLSARLGQDPLRVQAAGGNTSLKEDGVLWIKASGTELANAETDEIFVAVDLQAARAEVNGAGDGSCKACVLDPSAGLRPSIETTFHAAFEWRVVAHTHSIATLTHAVSPQGRIALKEKMDGLPWVSVPYVKPGLPLTQEIMAIVGPQTQIVVLENHGLICAGNSVDEVAGLVEEVEARLEMPASVNTLAKVSPAPDGFSWAKESWIAFDPLAAARAASGSYYPDHVVFLGAALTETDHDATPPAILMRGEGVALRDGATPAQQAMLTCLADLLARVPETWTLAAIGADAEAELLDWDAEKYRQALAARS